MNITIIGAGKIGKSLIAHLLEENHNITLIETNASLLDECINNFDINGIVGNGASLAIQKEANTKDADLVIAVTGSDEFNILCCIVAKKLGNARTIARVRNPEYAKQVTLMRDELCLDAYVNPELDCANKIARLLRFPGALNIETFSNGKVDIAEIKVEESSPLVGLNLNSVSKKMDLRFLVCAAKRNGEALIPNGEFTISVGDELYIVAAQSTMAKLFKKLNLYKNRAKDIMVCGGGKIAYFLCKLMEDDGANIKLIESNKERASELTTLLPKTMIINADVTDREVLLSENIEQMDAVVTLTGLDEENMFVSLVAKRYGVRQNITKVNRLAFVDIIPNTNLDYVVNTSEITVNNIIRYTRGMRKNVSGEFRTLYRLLDNQVEAAEFFVSKDSKYTNIPIQELKPNPGILIGAIIRQNTLIIPKGDDVIMPQDTVIIFAVAKMIKDLSDVVRK